MIALTFGESFDTLLNIINNVLGPRYGEGTGYVIGVKITERGDDKDVVVISADSNGLRCLEWDDELGRPVGNEQLIEWDLIETIHVY